MSTTHVITGDSPTPSHHWSHDRLAADLAAYFRGMTDRVSWLDMQMGPRASPRPDVYTMTKSFAHPQFVSYECKISVSDFRSDVTSGKWQKYLAFSHAVYFAVPDGLIKKSEIPSHCGLMVRFESGWRTVKKATNNVFEMPKECWLKLLIDGLERQTCKTPRLFNQWIAETSAAKKFGDAVGRAARDLVGVQEEIRESREQAKKRLSEADAKIAEKREAAMMEVNEARAEMARVLGLPRESNLYLITREWQRRVRRLSENEEIRHLREQLGTIRNAVNAVDHPAQLASEAK